MRDDFCVFILTHGRASNVLTAHSLEVSGYTGPLFFVVDDEDAQVDEYRNRYGAERVIVFDKAEAAKSIDEGDNFGGRKAILYARNEAYRIARELGFRYFIQLDDDYTRWEWRYEEDLKIHPQSLRVTDLDTVFSALVDYLHETPPLSIVAISQGGDWIGGHTIPQDIRFKRKVMNSFVCDTERPVVFRGRMNEDVTMYVGEGRKGKLFCTTNHISIKQAPTQSLAGGMTEMYMGSGTYVKSFYSVMYQPSCVKIGAMHRTGESMVAPRIHHKIDWNACAPKILREEHQKPRATKGLLVS
jgi:hypothetical protein